MERRYARTAHARSPRAKCDHDPHHRPGSPADAHSRQGDRARTGQQRSAHGHLDGSGRPPGILDDDGDRDRTWLAGFARAQSWHTDAPLGWWDDSLIVSGTRRTEELARARRLWL